METPKSSLNLADWAVLIPVLAGYFVLYGAVNLMTYYGSFGVQIISYIGFTEIISYFIKDIRTVLIQVLWIAVAYPIFYSRIKAFGKTSEVEGKDVAVKKDTKKPGNIVIAVAGVIMFGFFFIWEGWRVGVIAVFILALTVPLAFHHLAHLPNVVIAVMTFVCFTLMSFVEAERRAQNVLDGADYGVEFKIGDQLIKSDSAGCYIGKTERYIFFYDRSASTTIVYPVEKVEYISIPKDGHIKVDELF